MEKKAITVKELIDQLNEIENKNIPVFISAGANLDKLMEGDILPLDRLNTVIEEDGDKKTIVGLNIVSGDVVINELGQALKALYPGYAYGRVASVFTKFLTGKGFSDFCNNGNIIMTSVKKHLGGKLSEADAKKLKDIRDLVDKILGNNVKENENE